MRSRHHATKPSIALWMLVAIGDLALLVASVGMVAMIALASVVAVAVATVGGWLLLRRGMPNRTAVPARVGIPTTGRTRAGSAGQLR
jgi:predicted lysophospholipase L1 biosynthesis ABC-type transport system permease subunit